MNFFGVVFLYRFDYNIGSMVMSGGYIRLIVVSVRLFFSVVS